MSRKHSYYGAITSWADTLSTNFNGTTQYCRNIGAHRFNRATSFSVGFWFKLDSLNTNQLLTNCINNSGGTGWLVNVNSGKINFTIVNSGVNSINIQSTTTIVINTWYCVVATYLGTNDGGTGIGANIKLYINGVSEGTGTGTVTAFTNSNTYQVCGFANLTSLLFKGKLDELYIYSAVKNSTFATDFYNSGKPKNRIGDTNVISGYRMGDGSTAPTINDIFGSNPLTMVNSPTFVTDVP